MTSAESLLEAIRDEQIIIDEYVQASEDTVACLRLLERLRKRQSKLSEMLKAKRHDIYLMKQDGFSVDHIDGDISNNQLSNLRVVTWKENLPRKRGRSR